MKKPLIIIPLLLLLSASMFAEKSITLKPQNHRKRVTLISSGKKRAYYSLSHQKESVIIVRGPGTLRILTRVRFKPDDDDKQSYKISYSVDGNQKETIKFKNIKRSRKATFKKGTLGVPGRLEDFKINLGRGYHTIILQKEDYHPDVDVRYKFTPSKPKKRTWVELEPLTPYEPVELISREETFQYYRFSAEKPLKVEIIGPTTLRIFTRVENDHTMKGRIQYRLLVKKDGKIDHTYQLNSRKSEISTYKNNGKKIPGKAKIVVFTVPKGKHIYEIAPMDKDKHTLLGKTLFPRSDTRLEEK